MGCRGFDRLLSRLLDDRLTVEERSRVDQHLDGCPDCKRELALLRQSREVLGTPGPAVPPPGLAARAARAAFQAREAPGPASFAELLLGWKWAAAGAMGVAAVLLAVAVTLGPGNLRAGQGVLADPVGSIASQEAAGLARSAMVSDVLAEEEE